jgi:hypothetical protein
MTDRTSAAMVASARSKNAEAVKALIAFLSAVSPTATCTTL